MPRRIAQRGQRNCWPNRTRLQRKNAELQAALERYTGRQGKNRATLPVTLPTHVALSAPPASARGFARSVKDLLGCGARSLYRTAVSRIRDAFAVVVKAARGRMRHQQLVSDMARRSPDTLI